MQEEIAERLISELLECSRKLDEVEIISREIEKEDERESFHRALGEAYVEGVHKLICRICFDYPLLSPWKRQAPDAQKALKVGFDIESPWHMRVYESYRMGCNSCGKGLTYDDVQVGDLKNNVLEFCVALSDYAKKAGWRHEKKYTFLCPSCSSSL